MSRKSRVARLSILSNAVLIALKFVVGIMTGAVSIISEAVHSLMDLVAAVIAYVSVRFADRPPDKDHPYGHEKMENISSVIETILIFVASFLIIKQAVHKLVAGSSVESAPLGIAVMAVSAVVNIFVSRRLYAVAREEGSVAIEADALHLKADVYTSAGVALGLLVLWITGLHFLDPVIAILIALFILKEATELLMHSFGPLIDARLSDEEIGKIRSLMAPYRHILVDFHELRTRRSGNIKHIDLHVTAPHTMTVKEFHDICDRIEADLAEGMRGAKILIHGEPCDNDCPRCSFGGGKNVCAFHAEMTADDTGS